MASVHDRPLRAQIVTCRLRPLPSPSRASDGPPRTAGTVHRAPIDHRPIRIQTRAESRRPPMATGIRKVGEFCWTNMLTPRPVEAMEFFGRVLGWTYYEMPGMGHGVR